MTKKKESYLILSALLIIILMAVGIFYFKKQDSWNAFQDSQNQSEKNGGQVTVKKIELIDASASIGFKITAAYPEISGLTNTEAQAKINSDLKSLATSEVDKFKQEVNSASKNIPVTGVAELIMSYKVSEADQKIVSVWFSVMDSQLGAAHPNNYNLTYNFDLTSQKQLQIADLFPSNNNYPLTLSELAIKDLESQPELKDVMGLSSFAQQGAGPQAENFKLFNLTTNNLILIFDPGTVAPEFAGTRSVTLPISILKQASPILGKLSTWLPNAKWGQATSETQQIEGKNVVGQKVTGAMTTDSPSAMHFEDKEFLQSLGFVAENSLSADGPGSSSWGYKSASQFAIFSFRTQPTNTNPNEPIQFNCPCSTTVSAFVGNFN